MGRRESASLHRPAIDAGRPPPGPGCAPVSAAVATGVVRRHVRLARRAPVSATASPVNSFTAVSLDPPLVLVSIAKRARGHELLDGKPFSVNVLGAEQELLARRLRG